MSVLSQNVKLTTTARAAWDWWNSTHGLPQDFDERRNVIRERVVAWWKGEILDTPVSLDDDLYGDEDDTGEPEAPFSSRRLRAIEEVWGSGFLEPGGERYARKLLAVLAVTSKQTVLDLTAGLGGTARAIASHRGLWMDALEPIAELAVEGQRRSAAAGVAKQVTIKTLNTESPDLAERRYDAVYSRERFCGIANKEQLLEQISIALKERGQFLLTDFIATEEASNVDASWPERGDTETHLWSLAHYRHALEKRGLLVQIAQDITPEYLDHIHATWVKIPSLLTGGKLSRRNAAMVINEGELWQKRTDALVSGAVGLIRIHAVRAGG